MNFGLTNLVKSHGVGPNWAKRARLTSLLHFSPQNKEGSIVVKHIQNFFYWSKPRKYQHLLDTVIKFKVFICNSKYRISNKIIQYKSNTNPAQFLKCLYKKQYTQNWSIRW